MATALRTLYLRDDESGQRATVRKGDEIPEWATVTNPKASSDAAAEADDSDPLETFSVETLKAAAAEWDLDVPSRATKKRLVALLRDAGYEGDGSEFEGEE